MPFRMDGGITKLSGVSMGAGHRVFRNFFFLFLMLGKLITLLARRILNMFAKIFQTYIGT